MKYLQNPLLILIITIVFSFSCKKSEQVNNTSPYLTVQKVGMGTMANLDPELLQVIKEQMVEQGRADDTTRLFRTYDAKTGMLLIKVEDAIFDTTTVVTKETIDSLSLGELDTLVNCKAATLPWDHYYLKVKAHLAGEGWTGNDCGPVSYNVFVGTRGESRRMEAFVLSHDNVDPMIIPDIRYQAKVTGSGWLTEQRWNGVAGTTGLHKTMVALKIKSSSYGYTTRYYIHLETYGDKGPYYNGAAAGEEVYKRIEGMWLDIYHW